MSLLFRGFFLSIIILSCSKSMELPAAANPLNDLQVIKVTINEEVIKSKITKGVPLNASIKLEFNSSVANSSVEDAVSISNEGGVRIPVQISISGEDRILEIKPLSEFESLSAYRLLLSSGLKSPSGKRLLTSFQTEWVTGIDTSKKFPLLSDEALLDTIQKSHFMYFWEFGHPDSGLARERTSSGQTVTIGGSGFGLMALPIAINRQFISKSEGLVRALKIVQFLKSKAQKYHGAFPHWIDGTTGKVIPFSLKDDGADLVETSYLIAGLLTVRQFFNSNDEREQLLRTDINTLCDEVEWNWFRNNNQNVLYWHWSPNYSFAMNHPIRGWNECLITYILAASASKDPISATVYHDGFAKGSTMKNGNSYFGHSLPLGPSFGGPLFFSHFSFLGINPFGLKDQYADYQVQVVNHTKINYQYCVSNPKNFQGYSKNCWGLTASDIPNGYAANDPTTDIGVISPTAALSSMPYTPEESMRALRFYYYVLGDRLFSSNRGFADAFSLEDRWFSNSHLAIDQGPIVIMIENYRTGLVWNLLTSCSEIKAGMKKLGFSAPYL